MLKLKTRWSGEMTWSRRCVLATLCLAVISGFAAAEDFPARPITFVVPFTPGAATDFLARMLGRELEEKFGKPVVVENRPGAGTNIGSNSVAKAAPDGHTLLMATSTPMAINASLYKNLPYDPTADFVPLAVVAQSPFVLIAKPSLPVNSAKDLIALAKEKPGQLSFGSAGPGSPHHLFAELLASMSGAKINHVAYRGSVPALNDVVAGHIDFMLCDFASAASMIEAKRVKTLGVSTAARIPGFADIPPLNEAGLPGYDVAAWFMVVTTGKSPQPAVDRLHAELTRSLAKPEIKQQLLKLSLLPMQTKSVREMQDFVKSEIARWGKVVEQAGIAGSQ
ncbi:MAG: tripartite tricarboxylate transporter substrate binding protein [Xanthobacteraceae bacterium]|nr:tripartite tricarboxylate transporter substrate binding protein [Xanthobacteraceae bacterium]